MSEQKRFKGDLQDRHVDVTGGGGAKWIALALAAAAAGGWLYMTRGGQESSAPIEGPAEAGDSQ